MLEFSQAFDANYYSTMNPELAAAGLVVYEALFNHFITFGIDEGRSFSPYVDIDYYAAVNPDLQAAGLTTNRQLLDHLIAYGVNEKRLFSLNVDLNFYAAANQDLGAAGLTTGEQLFDHLINYGAREGRQLVANNYVGDYFYDAEEGITYVYDAEGNAYVYDAEGNVYFDSSWQPDNGRSYYPELASLIEEQWDIQSGDNNQFEQYPSGGGGDQRWKTDDRIEQIYTDLSTAIFGYRVSMGAGYAYDESYHNNQAIINGTTGWWHSAFDMGADYGTPIKAAVGGTVQWIEGSGDGYVGVGINSDDGRQWIYYHLQSSSGLWEGKRINAGEDVGLVGWFNGAPHLHLAVGNGPESIVSEMQDRDKLLSVTVSPLMAYWQWRNR